MKYSNSNKIMNDTQVFKKKKIINLPATVIFVVQ